MIKILYLTYTCRKSIYIHTHASKESKEIERIRGKKCKFTTHSLGQRRFRLRRIVMFTNIGNN